MLSAAQYSTRRTILSVGLPLGGVALLAACGQSGDRATDAQAARTPVPAPRVALSADDRERWVRGPPDRSAVPALVYRSVAPEDFARQMVLLDHAGYETITLETFVRFVNGEDVSLPPRPLLLTFDGGRLDSWTRGDAILRERGFAVVFMQDRSAFAKAGASNPFGRIDVTPDVDAAGLRALLAP